MKGRYNGCRMTIYGTILPGARTIARSAALTDKLTERAKYKIKILDYTFMFSYFYIVNLTSTGIITGVDGPVNPSNVSI